MTGTSEFYFLSDLYVRRMIRISTLFIYFLMFQGLILLQKPFLQYDFVMTFYSCFGFLFAHHLANLFVSKELATSTKSALFSYLADFVILLLFMKYFPYLSSFILILQLFLLFVASFDLDLFELTILGFVSSLGVSIINMSAHHTGAMQGLLSLTLFNLSYISVIVISRQLRSEFVVLKADLSTATKKWKTQEQLANTVMENIPLGVAVFQKKTQPVFQNRYVLNRLQFDTDTIKNLVNEWNISGANASARDIVYRNKNNERKVLHIDRTTYFDSVVSEDLEMFLLRDVTQLRELEFQSKQNEKLAAIGQLAAGIAHEIRNPLAGISGSIQLLSQDSQDETQLKLMKIVLKEIDRLNLLITEFLDYAKPEKLPDARINLKNTMDEVVQICKRHPEVPLNFEWKVELEPVEILGFNEKLKQAFMNIVINGIQAMKDKTDGRFSIQLKTENDLAVVIMKDNGIGMSDETKKKMFEPFHTTKAKGTGLGLAVTHKILETHRATISVNSESNIGTEFIIKFPLA